MENRTLIVNRGKFEIKVEALEDMTRISFQIPKQEEGINPDDYSYLMEHIMQLCLKKDEAKYNVFVDGFQTQVIGQKTEEIQALDTE